MTTGLEDFLTSLRRGALLSVDIIYRNYHSNANRISIPNDLLQHSNFCFKGQKANPKFLTLLPLPNLILVLILLLQTNASLIITGDRYTVFKSKINSTATYQIFRLRQLNIIYMLLAQIVNKDSDIVQMDNKKNAKLLNKTISNCKAGFKTQFTTY